MQRNKLAKVDHHPVAVAQATEKIRELLEQDTADGLLIEEIIQGIEPDISDTRTEYHLPAGITGDDSVTVSVVRFHGQEAVKQKPADQWESHFIVPTAGRPTDAVYIKNGVASVLSPGENITFGPGDTHFSISDQEQAFTAIVVRPVNAQDERSVGLNPANSEVWHTYELSEQVRALGLLALPEDD